MKNYFYLFICCIGAIFYSCTKNTVDIEKREYLIIESSHFEGGKLKVGLESSSLTLTDKAESEILNFARKNLKLRFDQIVYTEYSTASSNSSLVTSVVFHLATIENNQRIPFGFNLIQPENKSVGGEGLSYIINETHSCEGDPCSCCSFNKVNGRIKGCSCDGSVSSSSDCSYQYGQKCNHSVTSGG